MSASQAQPRDPTFDRIVVYLISVVGIFMFPHLHNHILFITSKRSRTVHDVVEFSPKIRSRIKLCSVNFATMYLARCNQKPNVSLDGPWQTLFLVTQKQILVALMSASCGVPYYKPFEITKVQQNLAMALWEDTKNSIRPCFSCSPQSVFAQYQKGDSTQSWWEGKSPSFKKERLVDYAVLFFICRFLKTRPTSVMCCFVSCCS
jgi:hypothetical protein